MIPAPHERLLRARLRETQLDRLTSPEPADEFGRVILHSDNPDALQKTLLATGRWIEDPLPDLRARQKPWVRWSVRERRPGVGLHVEREEEVLRAHLDFLSPGSRWSLIPLHVVIDLWGWRTLRPALLTLAGRRAP